MKEMFSFGEILQGVGYLGNQIINDIPKSQPVILIGILDGAMPFLNDLATYIEDCGREVLVETIGYKSYQGEYKGSGTFTKNISTLFRDQIVILVDDINDTGQTLQACIISLMQYNLCKEVKTCTFIQRDTSALDSDYVHSVHSGDEWFIGYGMDDNGVGRFKRSIKIK